jgi:hypothetical protein
MTLIVDSKVSKKIKLHSKNLLKDAIQGKIKMTTPSKKTSIIFPFTKVPKGVPVDMSKIDNPLETAKIVKPKITTLKQSIASIKKNKRIQEVIQKLTDPKNKKIFDINKVGQLHNKPIGLATFNGITQRLVDPEHVADILENMVEGLLSPVFATTSADGTFPAFDTMHGSHAVGILAELGLWGNNPAKWEDFEFPFFVIDNQNPFFADEAAYRRNGKGQRKWLGYDYHRIKVAAVRRGLAMNPPQISTNSEYILAERLQTLCEQYEAIPLADKHQHNGKAGTLGRIDALTKWAATSRNNDLDELAIPKFILETHKKYWHGTVCDSAMYGLYGNLYLEMHKIDCKMKGKEWSEFLDRLHATLFECFTDLAIFRSKVENAYTPWYENAFPTLAAAKKKKSISPADDCALSIVLKIMKHAGETHDAVGTNTANSYVKDGFDIYDFLEDEVLETVERAISK